MSNEAVCLLILSVVYLVDALEIFEEGKKDKNLLISKSASISFSKLPSATDDFVVCVKAQPNSSAVTSSEVTVLTTSGPVTNI